MSELHTFQEDCWCNGPPIVHQDDSYGDCVTCREYIHHTDDEMRHVAFPCAVVRESEAIATGAKEAEEDAARLYEALLALYRAPLEAHYEAALEALRRHDERVAAATVVKP